MEYQPGSYVDQAGSLFLSDSDTFEDDAFNFASDASDYSFLPDGDFFGSMGYAVPAGAPPTPGPPTPASAGGYLSSSATTSYGQLPDHGYWSMGPMAPVPTPVYPPHESIPVTSQWQFGEPNPRLAEASGFDNQFAISQLPSASQAPLTPPPTLPSPLPTDEPTPHISRAQRRRIQRDQVRQPRRRKTPPPRVSCDRCQKEVADERSLGRHRWEKHSIPYAPATDDGTGHGVALLQKFKCRCGYESPRRSNYLRHLGTCDPRKHVDDIYFRCECGAGHESAIDHQNHISSCGKKKVGRPAKADTSETHSTPSSSLLSRQVSQRSYYTL